MMEEIDFKKYPQIGFRVVTNGTLITEAMINKMRNARFLSVFVSVNAATPDTYGRIMKGARWEKTMSNIKRLVDFRNSLAEPFAIGFSFVVMKSNVTDLPYYPDLGKHFGITPHVVPLRYDPGGESLFENPHDVKILVENLALMQSRATELGINIGTGQLEIMIEDFNKKYQDKKNEEIYRHHKH